MSIFELAFFVSLLAGPITGGVVGRPFGAFGVIVGVIGGLAVALACHFVVLGLSAALAKIGHSMDGPPTDRLLFIPWWIANFASVMMIVLSPLGTLGILAWVAALLKQ